MTTAQAALVLWIEASATAVAYAALGATAQAPRARLRLLLFVVGAHAVLAAAAWRLADGPGELRAACW